MEKRFRALAIHTPAAGPAPDKVIGTTVAALKTRPMAVRMAILRSGKSGRESLYIVGANYSSDVLNAGTTGYDPDDLSMIARVPTLPAQTALVRLVPSKLPDDEQDEQQLILERAMKPCVAPSEQPGAQVLSLKESFQKEWEEAHAANEIKNVQKTHRPRSDRSTSSSRSGRTGPAANPNDTNVSAAVSYVSTPGKY